MTQEDWKQVEEKLSWPYGVAILHCDGYRLTLQVKQDKMRLVILFYVDGWFKGEWLLNDCEERRRFCRPQERYIHPAKMRTPKLIKIHKKYGWPLPDKKITSYWPWWNNFKTLKAHLIKNNKSVEIALPEPEGAA